MPIINREAVRAEVEEMVRRNEPLLGAVWANGLLERVAALEEAAFEEGQYSSIDGGVISG